MPVMIDLLQGDEYDWLHHFAGETVASNKQYCLTCRKFSAMQMFLEIRIYGVKLPLIYFQLEWICRFFRL